MVKKIKAFTIIELIIVIAIIATLAAIAVPAGITWIRESKVRQANENAHLAYTAVQDYLTQLEIKNTSMAGIDLAGAYGYVVSTNLSNASGKYNNTVPTDKKSVYGVISGIADEKAVDFSKYLNEFEGYWVVYFNPQTYTVYTAKWYPPAPSRTISTEATDTARDSAQKVENTYITTGVLVGCYPNS